MEKTKITFDKTYKQLKIKNNSYPSYIFNDNSNKEENKDFIGEGAYSIVFKGYAVERNN